MTRKSLSKTKDEPKYLYWIASLPCILCGNPEVQAAHYRKGFFTMQRKPPNRVFPLCVRHHDVQHSVGEDRFWADNGTNPKLSISVLQGLYERFDNIKRRELAEEWISLQNRKWKLRSKESKQSRRYMHRLKQLVCSLKSFRIRSKAD
jgi:hypothetical protein